MLDPAKLLSGIPAALRDPLFEEFRGIATAFAESKWKAAALDAGRFCEVVYTVLDGALSGAFATAPSKPARFPEACKALESRTPVPIGDHSLRILIPRSLPPIYDIRNNRNVGHVGGDVSPNFMDASFTYAACSWVLAELIRVFHGSTTMEAQAAVDLLAARKHPLVWEFDDVRRVLDPKMSPADRALVLLHSRPTWISASDLQRDVNYSNSTRFRKNILRPLEGQLLIVLHATNDGVMITPRGSAEVEHRLLKI